jgi:bifunctional UDP-N-acetylglucosamine pyrophosphorylase/glucosamine-1-phosphate N-acetyltransferase/UDP-N-acetylglucosamine pyrophosphorylase
MDRKNLGIVILAAGKGKRMKSDLPKVLHTVNGRTMISKVVQASLPLAPTEVVIVVGHMSDLVKSEVSRNYTVKFALQKELLGTGDAVRTALPCFGTSVTTVLVLCGDTPLIRTGTLEKMIDVHMASGADVTLLAVDIENPTGYGRVVRTGDGSLACIREEADASEEERSISIVNSGIYCVTRKLLDAFLDRIDNNNAQGEYYLTDIVGMAVQNGLKTGVFMGEDSREVMGVNTLDQLKTAEKVMEELH